MSALDPRFAEAERILAAPVEPSHSRTHELIQQLDELASQAPRVADRCYAYQARLHAALQEYELALKAVARAIALMPTDSTLLILRGDIHRQFEETSQALRDYSQALESQPTAVTARMHRAEVLQAKGRFSEALEDINTALQREPRSLRLIYRRGLILVDMRRVGEAMKDFRMVAQVSPDLELKSKAEQRLHELGER
jgi:tetratricopeptide (TPR) repeat protein